MEIDNWKQLGEKFREHFPSSGVDINDHKIIFQSSSATLEITRDGEAMGEMPLHSFNADNITDIDFDDDSVKITGKTYSYRFRK